MAKKWIQKAIKHPGALHKALKVPAGQKIPAGKLAKAAKSSNPKLAKQANLAKTLGKMRTKKYAEGGDVDVDLSNMDTKVDTSKEQLPDIENMMSFGARYRLAQKRGEPVFTWRGKRYSSDPTGDMGETVVKSKRDSGEDIGKKLSAKSQQRMDIPPVPERGRYGTDYSANPDNPYRPQVDPEVYSQQARMEGTLKDLGTAATALPIGRGLKFAEEAGEAGIAAATKAIAKDQLKQKQRANLARNLASKVAKDKAAKDAETRAVYENFARQAKAKQGLSQMPGVGMKRGGSVKGFAKGGAIRGGGCETKGRTRGKFI
jgi:hypothetical protein